MNIISWEIDSGSREDWSGGFSDLFLELSRDFVSQVHKEVLLLLLLLFDIEERQKGLCTLDVFAQESGEIIKFHGQSRSNESIGGQPGS